MGTDISSHHLESLWCKELTKPINSIYIYHLDIWGRGWLSWYWWGIWFKLLCPKTRVADEWGALFKLLVLPISRVTADYVCDVVCGNVVVCGVILPCPKLSMHHIIHNTVAYHIHTCIIILRPLHHWWGIWNKLLFPKTRVAAENVWGIVGGHAMVCLLVQSRQTWFLPCIMFIQQCDSISIPQSSRDQVPVAARDSFTFYF